MYSAGSPAPAQAHHELPSQSIGQPDQIYRPAEVHVQSHFDGEMSKEQPLPQQPTAPQTSKDPYYNQSGQPQPQVQPGNMAYPSTANGGYQTVVTLANLSRAPAPVDCPRCNQRGMTECDSEAGGFTK
jgi:hypothetical protein